MFSLIPTEAVTVIRPTVERDDLGEPIEAGASREEVRCVVCPGATSDMDATRPEGVTVSYTLHFPKTYAGSLRGCSRCAAPATTWWATLSARPRRRRQAPGTWP